MAQQRSRRAGGSHRAGARDAHAVRPSVSSPGLRERVYAVIEPVVVAAGFDLEDLTVARVGRRYVLRIAVDSDAGVDLDAVADLSRRISDTLDEVEAGGDELIAGEYELEVGSPGVDRPLTEPRHWRRNVRRLVRVRVGENEITGRIVEADGGSVALDVDGRVQRLDYARLGPGRVQVELKRLAELPDEELSDEELSDDDEEGVNEA